MTPLLFPLVGALLLWVDSALAGVALVPTSPLIADGTTTSNVRLYVDGGGAKAKIKADSGKIGPVVSSADGVITFPFTPAAATVAGNVTLSVMVNGEASTIDVPVIPPLAGRIAITVDPPVLSSLASATIRLDPGAGGAVAADRRSFKVIASAGTVDAISPSGGGQWVAHYTPPKGLTQPLAVVISAVDTAAPGTVWGVATLPVVAKRSVSLDVQAGSSNLLVLGDRTYGPVIAAPSGKVLFSVDADPRQPRGQLTSVNLDTSRDSRVVDMPNTESTTITWLAGPTIIPAGATALLHVATTAAGALQTSILPVVTASAGTVAAPVVDGSGFAVTFTAPTTPGEVTLTAVNGSVQGVLKVKVIAGPGAMTLVTSPLEIAAGSTSIKVIARLKDSAGFAVVGHPPALQAEGGTISALKDNADGSYSGTVKLSNSSVNLLRIWGSPATETTGLSAVRLLIWPTTSTVAADGSDSVALTVLAVDAWGLPVPNQVFKLSVPRGDGSLPPEVKTDARGLGRTRFQAGRTPGLVTLRAEGAGLWAEAPIVQATGAGATIPVGGPPDVEALLERWRNATPETIAIRTGTAPLSGPPASVSVSTVPPYTTPGANILVTVRVADASGKGVPGQKLAISAAPAAVGAVTDNHDGSYTFVAQLPAGTDGPLAISAGAESAIGRLNLPTLANAASVSAPSPTTSGSAGNAGGAPAAQRVQRQQEPSEFKKIHIGILYSNAHGSYTMTGNGAGGLIGGADYKAPALGFSGLTADMVFWPIHTPIGDFGLDGRVDTRVEFYNVLGSPGIGIARDAIAGLRYRRAFGALSVQSGLAFQYTNGNVFTYTSDFSGAQPSGLPLYGARLAALAMLETGRIYTGIEAAETFAPFPVVTRLGGVFQFGVTDTVGIRIGAGWDYRSMTLATATGGGSAHVVQSQSVFDAGVGWML